MDFDWYRIFWINPKEIKNGLCHPIPFENFNHVIDGDWDLDQKRFEEFQVYKETCAFFEKKEKGTIYSDRPEKERCIRIERLRQVYEDIKLNGYRDQRELLKENKFIYNPDGMFGDEIVVAIDRLGHLILANGWHRFSIAKLLDIKSIAVRIGERHKLWVDFCNESRLFFYSEWKPDYRGEVYQPIEHVDFFDLKPIWTSYRYDVIKRNMSTKNGTLLDIGSLFGYFCFKFENDGFDCTAVEIQDKYFQYLSKFKEAKYSNFKILKQSIFDLTDLNFDVVLAFNICHHFLKEEDVFKLFKDFLQRLKVKEFFLQVHAYDDYQMKNAYINFKPYEFAKFVSHIIKLETIEKIGLENQREIYRIFK